MIRKAQELLFAQAELLGRINEGLAKEVSMSSEFAADVRENAIVIEKLVSTVIEIGDNAEDARLKDIEDRLDELEEIVVDANED